MLHLGLEVPHSSMVEVLDLSQRGERDDVATFPDAICMQPFHLPFLYVLLAVLHLRQSTCGESRTRMRLNIDSDSVKRVVMVNSSTGYTRLFFCMNVAAVKTCFAKRNMAWPGSHFYDIFISLLFWCINHWQTVGSRAIHIYMLRVLMRSVNEKIKSRMGLRS